MQVKLISITKPLIQVDGIDGGLSPEDLIVYTARVSNPSNQNNILTSDILLRYLIKHKHWSPFEMVDMTVEIKTSRAIAAQILRHKSLNFQEFSQRYSKATSFEEIELRRSGATNRQSSIDILEDNPFKDRIDELMAMSQCLYDDMLENGVAKECARMILPLTTSTTMYVKGSIRSWIHYLQIRTDENTQIEHRRVAKEIKKIFVENFPITSEVFYE